MTGEEVEQLRFMLQTIGWNEIHRPMLERERERAGTELDQSMIERPSPKHSDDFLKGYRRGLFYGYNRPLLLVQEHDRGEQRVNSREGPAVGDPYSPLQPDAESA